MNIKRISTSESKIKFNTMSPSIGPKAVLNDLGRLPRKDKYGNLITKKNRSHKISFADQVDSDKHIAEVKRVESYKDFNKIEEVINPSNNFVEGTNTFQY